MSSQFSVEVKHSRSLRTKARALGKKLKNLGPMQKQALDTSVNIHQLKQGGYDLALTRRKIKGYENAEDEAAVLRRAYIPKCIVKVLEGSDDDEYMIAALEQYKGLKESVFKLSSMSYEPRVDSSNRPDDCGGDDDQGIIDWEASKAYRRAKDAFVATYRRREGKRAVLELERLLYFTHNAELHVDHRINIYSYALRLMDVFGLGGRK